MEITGFVFVCIIFSIMLGVAGYCCLRVCSSEIPYNENTGSRKNSSASSVSIISETLLRTGSSVIRSNLPNTKTSAPAANGIKAPPRPQARNKRPSQRPAPRITVVDDQATAHLMMTSLYPPKPLPIEHQRSLDKLTIERETNRLRSRSRSRSACPPSPITSDIKVETPTPKYEEKVEEDVNLNSSTPTKYTIFEPSKTVSSSSPMYRRKMRYSSEPPLPPPPSYAEAIANRRSLVEPPLPREYLI